jgi:hypothetical protein
MMMMMMTEQTTSTIINISFSHNYSLSLSNLSLSFHILSPSLLGQYNTKAASHKRIAFGYQVVGVNDVTDPKQEGFEAKLKAEWKVSLDTEALVLILNSIVAPVSYNTKLIPFTFSRIKVKKYLVNIKR